jgi:hypothetical protein
MGCEKLKIVRFERSSSDVWNRLVDESPEAWLHHRTEWVELQTSLFKNESFMIVSDESEPLGIFVVYRSDPGPWWSFGTCNFFTGWGGGPATARGLSKKQRRVVVTFGLDYLKERAHVCRASHLEVRLPSLARVHLPPLRNDVNPLWEYGFSALPRIGSVIGLARLEGVGTPTMVVDLQDRGEEQLFASCDHDCRNAIRKAMRLGVTCVQDDGPGGLEAFHDAYKASHIHSGTQGRPLAFFQGMHRNLSEKGWLKIFLALHGEKPVASLMLLCYKDAVTYAAGGLDYDAHALSANNLLVWETMRWAKQEGKKWYETGLYFPYLREDTKLARTGKFKREFGGRAFLVFDGLSIYDWARYLERILLEETYAWRRRRSIKQIADADS